jgi:PGF-CTERM protein
MSRDALHGRLLAVTLCVLLLVTGTAGVAGAQDGTPNPCVGTIEEPPSGSTLVTMQGVKFEDGGFVKKPGMLMSFGPGGEFEYAWNGSARGRWWVYDVDPLANGNLLLVSTEPGITVVQELDPRTGENVWVKKFDGHNGDEPGFHPQNVTDAHDVDLINGDELLIADKGSLHHRLLIYDMGEERVTWQWNFSDYPDAFPRSGGGDYRRDWSHVNDVDKVGPGKYMASVRNFDQVIVVDRETKDIELTLGADDEYRFMNEQHNPQYLETESGNPSILVADSLNDRVVEWERRDGEWTMTWELVGGGLNEPRDADRLPNGNTLVVDRKGHRTMEVTPEGRVVWEVYTPWQPYDAERYSLGDEVDGPAAADVGVTGTHQLTNSAGFSREEIEACGRALAEFAPKRGLLGADVTSGEFVGHDVNGTNTTDPATDETAVTERDTSGDGPGFGVLVALAALLGLGLGARYRRRR